MVNISYLEIKEEYAVINIDSPKHGHFDILIDLDDVDKCKDITWSIQMFRCGKDKSYITYYATNSKVGLLHRYLMGSPKGMQVDHRDGNPYDNRKYNIRVCKQEDNNKNQSKYKNNTSGCEGVVWWYYNDINKWRVFINLNKKRIYLGFFDDFNDAVKARRKGELKYFGEYSRNDSISN